jgi:hypothetical protein
MRRHGPSMRARAGSGGVLGRRRRGHGQLLRGRRVERAHTQTHTGVGNRRGDDNISSFLAVGYTHMVVLNYTLDPAVITDQTA